MPTPANSSFSPTLPTLQIAWDSTSLGALKVCPRYYQYSIVEGWTPRRLSVHLAFGLWFHEALETYDRQRALGASHSEALRTATKAALVASWDSAAGRPYNFDDPNKNRLTLVRSVVWYLDQFADDPLRTVTLASGRPAVELSFRFEIELVAPTGEPYILCGHLDRLVEWQDGLWVVDRKTTKTTISPEWFEKFSPGNQFSLYMLAAKVVFGTPVRGLIVDGAQVAVTFTRFQRGLVPRRDDVLEEWYRDLGHWLKAAERYAEQGYWPQNDTACDRYGGCPFRGICAQSPLTRQEWLERDFTKRVWDPLIARGDI